MHDRLALRSSYSLLYGMRSPEQVVAQAAAYGARTVALTDIGNLYGAHEFLEAAKEAGLRPILGAQLTLGTKPLFAFVRDRQGFARLCELLSTHKRPTGFDLMGELQLDARGLVLATRDPQALERLSGKVEALFAAITTLDFGAISVSRKLGIPLAYLDEATCLEPADIPIHAVLRAIALGKTVGTLAPEDTPGAKELLLSPQKMKSTLESWPQAALGTARIADICRFDTIFDGFVFPEYQNAAVDASVELRDRVLIGAEQRYGELSDAIMQRIDYEMDIISRKGFAPYFLVMDDIVSMASRTCGRGSGAASIVSYALEITNVDPIAHKLYFERFLTIARPDPPDIDVDFAWDERDNLMRRVIERFGDDRCARVANHNRFRPRSALRETAKAFGIPDGEITSRERMLCGRQRTGALMEDPVWHEIVAAASRIEGLPRGLSMHCGGMVIAPGPIRRHAPIETSAEGYPLLTWEKEGTEAAGLVKIDLLGNRSLAVIRDAMADLRSQGVDIDPLLWQPTEDQRTIEALARGDSMGVFYIESPAMRQLQKKTGKGDFAHIVIHSSIIRPAANKYIAEYVRRLKGAPWDPLHPRLAYILDETYGILCYQEDVSKTAVALAGFNEADADKLRKVIAKKAGAAKLALYEQQFSTGCRANGVEEETIKEVWAMMLSFDGYSFCKPHSASYAMVSFQSAYLRVHHPAAFMAAVLSNQGGYYRPQAYISESRRMGLHMEGPDVNQSRYRYHSEGSTVIIGLMAIGRLSANGARQLIEEREREGLYTSLTDACGRLRLGREDFVALVGAGAFDSLAPGLPRSAQVRILLSGRHLAEISHQETLFPVQTKPRVPDIQAKALQTASRQSDQELMEEFQILGFLRDHHPLLLWRKELSRLRRIRASGIAAFLNRRVTLLGWPVTQKEVWTKDGLSMDFVSFEDESALYETVLFPQVFERYRTLLFGQQPLLVTGMVRSDQGALNIEVMEIRLAVQNTGNLPNTR